MSHLYLNELKEVTVSVKVVDTFGVSTENRTDRIEQNRIEQNRIEQNSLYCHCTSTTKLKVQSLKSAYL